MKDLKKRKNNKWKGIGNELNKEWTSKWNAELQKSDRR
jgi:hypothetical protein